jgi:hypothetical protein
VKLKLASLLAVTAGGPLVIEVSGAARSKRSAKSGPQNVPEAVLPNHAYRDPSPGSAPPSGSVTRSGLISGLLTLMLVGFVGTCQNGPPGPLGPSSVQPVGGPELKFALVAGVAATVVMSSMPRPRKPWYVSSPVSKRMRNCAPVRPGGKSKENAWKLGGTLSPLFE